MRKLLSFIIVVVLLGIGLTHPTFLLAQREDSPLDRDFGIGGPVRENDRLDQIDNPFPFPLPGFPIPLPFPLPFPCIPPFCIARPLPPPPGIPIPKPQPNPGLPIPTRPPAGGPTPTRSTNPIPTSPSRPNPTPLPSSPGVITIVPRQCDGGHALNILFMGQRFSSQDEFVQTAKTFADTFLAADPYKDYKVFEFTGVNLSTPLLGCDDLLQGTQNEQCGISIQQAATKYPHDVTVSLNKGTANNAYANFPPASYINITSVFNIPIPGSTAPKGFVHEFGHAFGDLLDEYYSPYADQSGTSKANCATSMQQTAAWTAQYGSAVQPTQRCFSNRFYRATPKGSMMNTPDYDWNTPPLHYDPVETDLLKKKLDTYKNQCIPHQGFVGLTSTPPTSNTGNSFIAPTGSSETNTQPTSGPGGLGIKSYQPSSFVTPTPVE